VTYQLDSIDPMGSEAAGVGLARQVMSADLVTRGDGWERGVRSVILQNDRLAIEVVIDRGLDIAGARVRHVPVGWRSATEIVAPWYVENSGFGPHRSFFGGLLKTCGLDHIGRPGTREVQAGQQSSGAYPMHGRISGAPGRLKGYGVQQTDSGLEAFIEGSVTQVAVFDEHLTLDRRVSIAFGSDVVRVEDTVTNHGFRSSPLAVLYHVNVGWPILAPGVEIDVPSKLLRGEGAYSPLGGPVADGSSRTWLFDSASGRDGGGSAGIFNPRIDANQSAGMRVRWDPKAMPSMVCWQMDRLAGNYVVAFEPSTLLLPTGDGQNHCPTIEPGQSIRLGVEIDLFHGAAA
jgi:hypothetical protein